MLALGAALCWSGLDITRKKLVVHVTTWTAVAGLTLFQLPVLLGLLGLGEFVHLDSAFGDVIFAGFPRDLSTTYWLYAAATIGLNIVANYLFFKAVATSPLSLTIPYLSFTPVFSGLTGMIFLGELPDIAGWIGISIVTLGAFFLNPGERGTGIFAPLKALWKERGSVMMIAVALIWSLSPIADKWGTDASGPVWHTTVIAAGMAGLILAVQSVSPEAKPWAQFKSQWKLFAICAGFNLCAMILQLASYAYLGVAYVETIKRAIGVVAAVAAGFVLFQERDLGQKLFAAVLMIVGIVLIML